MGACSMVFIQLVAAYLLGLIAHNLHALPTSGPVSQYTPIASSSSSSSPYTAVPATASLLPSSPPSLPPSPSPRSSLPPSSPRSSRPPAPATAGIATTGVAPDQCKLPADWLKGYSDVPDQACYSAPLPEDWVHSDIATKNAIVPDACESQLLSSQHYAMDVDYFFDHSGFHIYINPQLPASVVDPGGVIYEMALIAFDGDGTFLCKLLPGNTSNMVISSNFGNRFFFKFGIQVQAKIHVFNLPITRSQVDNGAVVNHTVMIYPQDAFRRFCRLTRCVRHDCSCCCDSAVISFSSLRITMDANETTRLTWKVGDGPVDSIILEIVAAWTTTHTLLHSIHLPATATEFSFNSTALPFNKTLLLRVYTEFINVHGKPSSPSGGTDAVTNIELRHLNWSDWVLVRDSNGSALANDSCQLQVQSCRTPAAPPGLPTLHPFCLHSMRQRTVACPSYACIPVDGGWSPFQPWTDCLHTTSQSDDCTAGFQFRTRLCNSPYPSSGGQPCPGESELSRSCSLPSSSCLPTASSGGHMLVATAGVAVGGGMLLLLLTLAATACFDRFRKRHGYTMLHRLTGDGMDEKMVDVYIAHYRPRLEQYLRDIHTPHTPQHYLLSLLDDMATQLKEVDPVLDILVVNNIQQKQVEVEEYFAVACKTRTWLAVLDENMCAAFREKPKSEHRRSDMTSWPEILTVCEATHLQQSKEVNVIAVIPSYVDDVVDIEALLPDDLKKRHIPVVDLRGDANICLLFETLKLHCCAGDSELYYDRCWTPS